VPRRAARIADVYQSPETTTATPRIERIDTGGARRHRPPTEAVPFTVSVQQSASAAHPAAPARRALAEAGYARLEQLTHVAEAELGQLHGMGPKALRLLREALAATGRGFKASAPGS